MLKPGGVFARFACHPWFDTNGQEELAAAIYRVYRKFVPEAKASSEYGEEDARRRADIAAKYGFADIQYKLYYRTQVYSSEEYIKRISIENDKIALPKDKRDWFAGGYPVRNRQVRRYPYPLHDNRSESGEKNVISCSTETCLSNGRALSQESGLLHIRSI